MNRNRLRLIDALRTLDTLPPEPKFRWNFGVTYDEDDEEGVSEQDKCGSVGCALGVAFILDKDNGDFIRAIYGDNMLLLVRWLADYFDMTENEIRSTFYSPEIYGYGLFESITPEMVADRLESLP